MTSKDIKALLASYFRSILGASAALYVAGFTEPKQLLAALVGALLPVLFRALNPNDPAFGKLPAAQSVADALKSLGIKK